MRKGPFGALQGADSTLGNRALALGALAAVVAVEAVVAVLLAVPALLLVLLLLLWLVLLACDMPIPLLFCASHIPFSRRARAWPCAPCVMMTLSWLGKRECLEPGATFGDRLPVGMPLPLPAATAVAAAEVATVIAVVVTGVGGVLSAALLEELLWGTDTWSVDNSSLPESFPSAGAATAAELLGLTF